MMQTFLGPVGTVNGVNTAPVVQLIGSGITIEHAGTRVDEVASLKLVALDGEGRDLGVNFKLPLGSSIELKISANTISTMDCASLPVTIEKADKIGQLKVENGSLKVRDAGTIQKASVSHGRLAVRSCKKLGHIAANLSSVEVPKRDSSPRRKTKQ